MEQVSFFCGVAGNRTRVQTSNKSAFYTFSFRLNFRLSTRPETAILSLVSKILTVPRDKTPSRFIFTVLPYGPPQTKAFRENPAFLPCRNVALSYYDSD